MNENEQIQDVDLDTEINETDVDTTEVSVDTAEPNDPGEEVDYKKKFTELRRQYFSLKNGKKPQDAQTSKTETLKETVQTTDFNSLVENFSIIKELKGEEISALQSEARDLGVDPVKYIKSNAGKAHLDLIRKQARSNDANPEIGAKSPVYKKYTQADLNNMSSAELAKILPHAE